eukprot:3308944-Pleurochrysis_carterae.AAC.8
MVALVAVEAAFASVASMRSSFLPLPLQARAYVRRAAGQVMVRRIRGLQCIAWLRLPREAASRKRTRSVRLKPEQQQSRRGVAVDCDFERVWRVVACKFEGTAVPWAAKTGFRGEEGVGVERMGQQKTGTTM